ncbi:hypothetical protein BD779DRAFT_1513791, partial [Infundibulicybe gibba]
RTSSGSTRFFAPSTLTMRISEPLSVLALWAVLGSTASLNQPLFKRLPTAAIKPAGWALDQAHVQANGLAGHLRDFDSYVNGSIWVEGGSIEYSEMHEAAPYWFNAMVALAFQIEDQRLIGQVRTFLDWTLDHQGEDGWIGPEPFVANATIPRLVWPRYLALFGLIQYAEADSSQTTRIVNAMHKFMSLANTIWKTNQQGDPSMGFQFDYQFVRWEELVYSLQWLYDNAPQGKEDELIETMQLVRNSGFSWKNDWFVEGIFPKVAVTEFTQHTHGVNTAEGATKSEALAWRFTGDPTDVQSTFDRMDMLYQYHGRASGTFSADEHIAGLDPSEGITELCAVVEQIFSLATIYQTFGNNSVADRAEKIAYNALPAGIMYDWWSHQYDQEVNQIWAQSMDPFPWGNNGPNSNVFGFEPNYPCCTVNHPQAYPKFWAHSFFTDQAETSLTHVLLGPSTFSGTLGSSNKVKVSVDTLYPFGSVLTYSITASRPFTFNIRVPTWAQNNMSTLAINKGKASSLKPDSTTSLQSTHIPAGTTTIHIETRSNGAVAITRGALNFAVEIPHNTSVAPGLRSAQALVDVKRLYPNAPPQYLTPVKSLPFYVWAPGAQPISMTARACQIEWSIVQGTASAPPPSPNACVGDAFNVKLVPFAAAKLRLGEIPTMKVS